VNSRQHTLAAIALLGLTGCAVTKIDVDVYKGPLSNQEDVQAQQFTVMASAAKPFLVRLRDTLEWGGCKFPDSSFGADISKDLKLAERTRTIRAYIATLCEKTNDPTKHSLTLDQINKLDLKDYKAEYMPHHQWLDIKAGRVNALLSLYEDLALPELAAFTGKAAPARRTAEDAAGFLEYRRNKDVWKHIEPRFLQDANAKLIAAAYRPILDETVSTPRRAQALRAYKAMKGETYPGYDELYAVLAVPPEPTNKAPIANDATLLFGTTNSPEARQFMFAVNEFAGAFRNWRVSVDEIWKSAIDALLDQARWAQDPSGTARNPRRAEMFNALARVVSEITQKQYLDYALCAFDSERPEFKLLRDRIRAFAGRAAAKRPDDWRFAEYTELSLALEQELRNDPAATTRALLQADRLMRERFMLVARCNPSEELRWRSDKTPPPFGLIRGPAIGPGATTPPLRLNVLLDSVGFDMAGGFEHARVSEGLETLTNHYVEISRPGRDTPPKDIAAAREQMVAAMITFAQRILFLANHDVLEAIKAEPEPLAFQIGLSREAINGYRVVLQAVGNAVLVQADDLKRLADYKKGLNDRAPAERWAVEHAIGRTGEALLASLAADARQSAQKAVVANDDAVALQKKTAKELETATADDNKAKSDLATANAASAPTVAQTRFKAAEEAHKTLTAHATAVKAALGKDSGTAAAVHDQVKALLRPYSSVTESYLEGDAKSPILAISAKAKDALYDDIVVVVAGLLGVARSAATLEDAERKKVSDAKQMAQTDANRTAAALAKAKKADDDAKASLPTTASAAEAAQALAKTIADYQIKLTAKLGVDRLPHDAYAEIRDTIDRDLAAAKAKAPPVAADVARLTAAVAFVAERNPPLSVNRVPAAATRPQENARDVMDSLIMALRDEHILTIREGGADSARAKSVGEALKAAYDYRGGMAYLRPAIAYLRSSYAATTLQDDSGATSWTNMLQESGKRASPFFSEQLANFGKTQQQRVNAEIDKQFWQTINRVRVSGAGLTNYVMVKDDIGNWYVKQYSADTDGLIKSAKSLALFNLGAALPGTGDSESNFDITKGPLTQGPLDKLLTRHREKYTTQTKDDYTKALALDTPLADRVSAAWKANSQTKGQLELLTPKLDAAKKTLTATLGELKGAKDDEMGSRIVSALQAGRRFHNDLRSAIANEAALGDARAPAAGEVTRVIRDALSEFLRSRQATVAEYDRSIIFIGDANK